MNKTIAWILLIVLGLFSLLWLLGMVVPQIIILLFNVEGIWNYNPEFAIGSIIGIGVIGYLLYLGMKKLIIRIGKKK